MSDDDDEDDDDEDYERQHSRKSFYANPPAPLIIPHKAHAVFEGGPRAPKASLGGCLIVLFKKL